MGTKKTLVPTRAQFLNLKKEILAWLPSSIINAHFHCGTKIKKTDWPKASKLATQKEIIKKGLFFDKKLQKNIYPGKKINFIGFPLPFSKGGIIPEYANKLMILEIKKGVTGCMLGSNKINILENAKKAAIKQGVRFSGIKFHIKLFKKYPKKIDSLSDFITPKILNFMVSNKLTIIFELVNGFDNKDMIFLKKLPKTINVVIPHLGFNNLGFMMSENDFINTIKNPTAKYKKDFQKIKNNNNIFLDTSLIINQRVINSALSTLGENRIIWGDDFPSSLTPKIKEYRPDLDCLQNDLNDIILNNKYKDAWKYYYNIYQQIKGIKNYSDKNNKNNEFKNKIFYENTKKIFNL